MHSLVVLFTCLFANIVHAQSVSWETWADTVIESVRQDFKMPNAAILVTSSQETLLSKGYGLANQKTDSPMTPDTQLQVASTAKTMSFFALMQMIDQGKIAESSDVFASLDLPQPDDGFGKLYISHLLTHTDGFADQTVGIIEKDKNKIWTQYDLFSQQTPARVVTSGSRIAYSNYGSIAAKALIEKLSGKELGEYMVNEFYRPMGMVNSLTALLPNDPRLENMAVEYRQSEDKLVEVPHLNPKTSTLVSTTNDMGVFLRMILNGGTSDGVRVLSEEMIAKAITTQFKPDAAMPGVSYGLMEHRQNGLTAWRRDGHGTESRSRILILPDRDLAFFTYTGIDDNLARDAVTDALFERLGGSENPMPKAQQTFTCSPSTSHFGPIQNDPGTYGKVQLWFVGVLRVEQDTNCTLAITPVNFDAYGGLEVSSKWHQADGSLFRRNSSTHGELVFTGEDLHMGTGMMGSYRKLSFLERPVVTLWIGIALCCSFVLTLMAGSYRFVRGQRGPSVLLLLLAPVFVIAYASLAAWGAFSWGGTLPAVPAYAFGPNALLKLTFATAPLLLVLVLVSFLMALKNRSLQLGLLCLFLCGFLWLVHTWNWTVWNAGV